VSRIRLYRLDGELPRMAGYDREPSRLFGTYTENGYIAACNFNVDPDNRWGHLIYGLNSPG